MISALGMGGTRFPPELFRTPRGRERCAELVSTAIAAGINYFDTAPLYCDGHSESIFGMAFSQTSVPVHVVAKTNFSMDPTADDVLRRLDHSLHALQVQKVTFLCMWNILDMEQFRRIMAPGGPYEGAVKAKLRGLADHICFSAHCGGRDIVEIVSTGAFEGVTLGYNTANFSFREEGLDAAWRHGLGVVVMNPLGGGVIPRNPDLFSWSRVRSDDSVSVASLRFVVDHPAVSTVLMGLANEAELEENLRCLAGVPLSAEERERMRAALPAAFDSFCTGCNYCQGCPVGIPVNRLMLSYNQYVFSGKKPSTLHADRTNVWGIAPEEEFPCSTCGACESRCTQHLPIMARIKEMNGLARIYQEELTQALQEALSQGDTVRTGVYACGPYARRLFQLHEKLGGIVPQELFFFDSDPRKWGKPFLREKWVIHPPGEILSLGVRRLLIASEAHFREIMENLQHLSAAGVELLGLGGQ